MHKKTQAKKEVSLGQRIRQLRREREWTQDHLAQAIDIHVQTIGLYEKGTMPTALVLKRMADVFGVTTDYLISGEADNTLTIKNKELLKRVQQLDRVNPDSLKSLLDMMDVYIQNKAVKDVVAAE